MSDVNYISREGLDLLKEELDHRKTITRKEISARIGTAKEQGDLSENFEYQEAKDVQAENEHRIADLEELIHRSVIVEQKTGSDLVSVGVRFSAETPAGERKDFEIVGPSETDPMAGKISNESPLGKAFLGKTVGEDVSIETASGNVSYKVVSIM